MSRVIDSLIAYRILRLLVIPFTDTEAFRLGIIDAKGKELKRMNQLNTVAERDAYTILHRMVFRIKRIIEKVPVENKKLLSFTAALALIKEHYNTEIEPVDLEYKYLQRLEQGLNEEDIQFTQKFLDKNYILSFKTFLEDAPANNAAATPGIDGFTPETLGVRKRKKITILKRSEEKNVAGLKRPF